MRKHVMRRGAAFFVLMFFVLTFTPGAYALSMSFSDQDYLGGASWGTMDIDVVGTNTLRVRYEAAPDTVIPGGSQITAFGFALDVLPVGVENPANGDFSGDRDDLDWIVLNNLNAIPNPANGDEFSPGITKFDFAFGVTEGNANNINPPGILPGEFDIFTLVFAGVDFEANDFDLEDFVNLTGIRLQSLPDDINGGSLFLAGDGDNGATPNPEPATVFLLGSGLIGLAAFRRKTKG
jgi:hypothetical protein